ncbi:RpiB/LacA/LacB family sugar-phosphate isomerase [Streptomyces sp. NPDC048516]|uniref:RpiB/LacA/LacB family sugar-phosphate isomerase n=1 Tax=Streptomyces sp. NPDC048516 TaxID=3365565 RepID=UPI00371DAC46
MTQKLTIALGGDERALDYKDALRTYLAKDPRVTRVIDVGADRADPAGYPHVAVDAAQLVASGEADRALVFCGTGLGVAISANTVPGIRAVTAHDPVSIDGAIKINNAQVLTMGSLIIGLGLVHTLVDQWLDLRYDPDSPWAPLVDAMEEYDKKFSPPAS